MGDMTRDQLVTEVCDTVGKSVSAVALSGATLQTRVRTYLNWAQQRIARAYNFYELQIIKEDFTFTANVKRYPFESGGYNMGLTRCKDIGGIILVDGYNSRRLVRLGRPQFERRFPRPENYAAIRPRIYIRVGNNVEVFPIPDAAYATKIVYHQWATPFTTANQVSDFQNKDQLLVNATILETYLALEEYQDVAAYMPKVQGLLKDAISVEGDVDWEPQAEPFNPMTIGSLSGTPWLEPGAVMDDPMYGYPDY